MIWYCYKERYETISNHCVFSDKFDFCISKFLHTKEWKYSKILFHEIVLHNCTLPQHLVEWYTLVYVMQPEPVSIYDMSLKLILNYREISSARNMYWVVQWFCNFAQGTAVSLVCCVQNSKRCDTWGFATFRFIVTNTRRRARSLQVRVNELSSMSTIRRSYSIFIKPTTPSATP